MSASTPLEQASPGASRLTGSSAAPDELRRPLVFISHDSRDAGLAAAFSELLAEVGAGMIECFRSSDHAGSEGIDFGEDWHQTLMSRLAHASDVVCLLTERSIERPWILYEAGMARGRGEKTPVHGVLLGTRGIRTGPFFHFQNCDGSESALSKLVLQLCAREPRLRPSEKALKDGVRAFRRTVADLLGLRTKSHGSTIWRRAIPLRDALSKSVREQVDRELDAVQKAVRLFFEERGTQIPAGGLRSNILLPDCHFRDKSQFPGQLCFFAMRPEESYSKQELGNRFAPGEGVSGKVFLDGVAFVEDGRAGVSAKKLKRMHRQLSAVAGFPLLDRSVQYAFGVVCVDLIGTGDVEEDDLRDLLHYEPALEPIRAIAALLNPADNAAFELEFTARF